jgi:hypothetical protein
MLRIWPKLPSAVGAIDGTSFEIYKPRTESQELHYSGYRHYITLFMRRLPLIIRVSYDTLNVDSQGIRMMPNSMPFYPIFPEEKYLSLMTVCYLPIKCISKSLSYPHAIYNATDT